MPFSLKAMASLVRDIRDGQSKEDVGAWLQRIGILNKER